MAAENLVLFKKGEGEKLVEVSASQAGGPSALITVDHKFGLTHFEAGSGFFKSDSLIPLTFTWQSYEDIKEQYELVLFLKKDGKLYMQRRHQMGYLIYPTLVWKKGETIKEHFWLSVPRFKKQGEYSLEMGFVGRSNNRAVTQKTYPLANLFFQK